MLVVCTRQDFAVSRVHEEFKRRSKTQTVLPYADTAAMWFWGADRALSFRQRHLDRRMKAGAQLALYKRFRPARLYTRACRKAECKAADLTSEVLQ